MNNFKEFLEILKLPPSILSALMIVSGLILILPENVVKKLYMYEFRNNYGFAISLIFLISFAILVVLIIMWSARKIIEKIKCKKLKEKRTKYLLELDDEKTHLNKENGNWHEEKVEKSELHKHGVDIKLVGGKRNSEYFYIECKGKSYAKSARSINREGWLNALGQIITRMDVKRYSISKEDGRISGINHAYKYGLGLYWESAQVALRRIPKEVAEVLCLHIFSVNDNGEVKYFTPSMFGKGYSKEEL